MDKELFLTGFFHASFNDSRLTVFHVGLYTAMLSKVALKLLRDGRFPVVRENIMKAAKIRSKKTYHKYMQELHRFGYIRYYPARSSYVFSQVEFVSVQSAHSV